VFRDRKCSDSPPKRVFTVYAVVCLLVLLWTINSQLIHAVPELAVWPFETVNVSEADAREYVDSLIYHLRRNRVLTVVDAGDRVLRFVPELSLTGALSKENESYNVSIRLDNNRSGEIIKNIVKSYSAHGELFEDSKHLVDEIVSQPNISEQFLVTEDIVSTYKYVFQGSIYDNRFSDYMDLAERIEARPDISEELDTAIKAYRRKG